METKKHPNADISELHLSDAMIDLLKNDRIDAPLLCELAAHPRFVKLLADIQIYIEGIATTQIPNLNSWVDVARDEIIQKYQPDNHDRTYQLLKASHIDEGEYFSKRIHDDIDCIMKDLRYAHIGRSDSTSKNSVAEELKQNLEEIMNFNGSRVEKLLLTFCMQTKIKYNKLNEEEKAMDSSIIYSKKPPKFPPESAPTLSLFNCPNHLASHPFLIVTSACAIHSETLMTKVCRPACSLQHLLLLIAPLLRLLYL